MVPPFARVLVARHVAKDRPIEANALAHESNCWHTKGIITLYGLVVIGLLGYLSTILMDELEKRLVPWK